MKTLAGLVLVGTVVLRGAPASRGEEPRPKENRSKVYCLVEEVKGTTAEVIIAGEEGKKEFRPEADLRLVIPQQIQDRVVELSGGSQVMARILSGIRVNHEGFDADKTVVLLSGVTGLRFDIAKFRLIDFKLDIKPIASKSLHESSYVSSLVTITHADGRQLQIKCDCVVMKAGETTDERGNKHDKRRALVTWYGPIETRAYQEAKEKK